MGWPFPMESAHPLVVHFPIALLLTAVILELVAITWPRPSLHRLALWNLCLGTVGAGLAVWTGLRAEAVARHSFEIHQVMELHKRLGITSLILALMAAGWRLRYKDRLSRRGRALALGFLIALAASLSYGAHLGGRLVYEFGVGGHFGRAGEPLDGPTHE